MPMLSMKKMASMVRTYMMLCFAGLLVTCILMVVYRRDSTEAKDIIEVKQLDPHEAPSSQRNIKGTHRFEKPIRGDYPNDAARLVDEEKEITDKETDVEESFQTSDDEDDDDEDVFEGLEDGGEESQESSVGAAFEPDVKETNHGDFKNLLDNEIPGYGVKAGTHSGALQSRAVFPVDGSTKIAGVSGSARGGTNSDTSKIKDPGILNGKYGGFQGAGGGTGGTGGTDGMANMRIAGATSKAKSYSGAGVQDLLRHPEEHIANANMPRCTPKSNIVLMKTHKCSSSTMQNILFRWGEDHNLTFALPNSGVYLGSPSLFSPHFVMPTRSGHYNILANHMRFSDNVKHMMPADSVYIGLLRDPATQYESMYNYYRFDGRYHMPLVEFLKNPQVYFQSEPPSTPQVGRNPMLFDMGLDARYLEPKDQKVSRYLDYIESTFDLILIAEYFKESLILLKERLCWTMDDITFFNQNARSKSSVRQPTAAMKEKIRWWNGADTRLYDRFNRTLWQRIDAFGRKRMASELAELDRRNTELAKRCIGSTKQAGDSRVYYPPGVNVKSFVLNASARGNQLCDQMTRPELTYISVLRAAQSRRNVHRTW